MKYIFYILLFFSLPFVLVSCSSTGNSQGELTGVSGRKSYKQDIPYGMVYIPAGTFIMGGTDQDITSARTALSKQVTIAPFFMDEAEITNNEYRQFVFWVRDSIAAKIIGGEYLIQAEDGTEYINPKKTVVYGSQGKEDNSDALQAMYYQGDDKLLGTNDFDVTKLIYQYTWFDLRSAALKQNIGQPRSSFIRREKVNVYPDTLVWIKDFSYAQNEPMVEQYFSHPAYDDYPVVGVNWRQATAFCNWRTEFNNTYRDKLNKPRRGAMSLPTEAQFEYAARGGRNGTDYPWGGPYIRNSRGCLLANFKPLRGNYIDDGGAYTVHAKSYFPNGYGLYNMSGNVAEWTSSTYNESSFVFTHDMNPNYATVKDLDDLPLPQRRKVIRGGSWKDIGYYLRNSTRTYEYADTAKSYIGFRCVAQVVGRIN